MDSVGWLCRVLVGWNQDMEGTPEENTSSWSLKWPVEGGFAGYRDNKVQFQPKDDVFVLFCSPG